MPRVIVPLAEGFEEVEAMAIIDVLRRAGIEVVTAGLRDGYIESARGVKVIPDATIDRISAQDFDVIVLPGGQPGADNLNADQRVMSLIRDFHSQNKMTCAICAAPYVLGSAGILEGKRATVYPSYSGRLGGGVYEDSTVVEDGNIITSRGPGTALSFALAIVEKLAGKAKADSIRQGMLINPDPGG